MNKRSSDEWPQDYRRRMTEKKDKQAAARQQVTIGIFFIVAGIAAGFVFPLAFVLVIPGIICLLVGLSSYKAA